MKIVKYLTLCSLFSLAGFVSPANAITFNFDKTTGDGGGRGFGTIELANRDNDGVLESEILDYNITVEETADTTNNFTLTPSNSDLTYGDNNGFLQDSGNVTEFILDTSGNYTSISFVGDNGNNDYRYGEFFDDGDAEPDLKVNGTEFDGQTNSPDNVIATSESVPFEAEGTMGLVAIGGFLGYRYLKKRKQALNQ